MIWLFAFTGVGMSLYILLALLQRAFRPALKKFIGGAAIAGAAIALLRYVR